MVSFNALFVAAEFAAVQSRKTRVSQMADSGNRLAKALLPILENPKRLDNYIATCQIGITISSLVLGAYGQGSVAEALKPWLAQVIGGGEATTASVATAETLAATLMLVLLTILQVIFGELLPKSLALQFPESVAQYTLPPMRWSEFVLKPFVWFLNGSGNIIMKILGIKGGHDHGPDVHSPEEIEILVSDSAEGGILDEDERQMLRNAFRMRDLVARQVMTPRTKLTVVPLNSDPKDVLRTAIDAGYSRIPLYEDNNDQIKGYVHVKDLFRMTLNNEGTLRSIMRDAIFIPETLSVVELWEKLGEDLHYIAIVLDEYGGTAGMITIEDLVEEITGEVQDEFDNEAALVSAGKDGRVYLNAELLVSDVNEYYGLDFTTEQGDTLGGLVFTKLGQLAKVGDEVVGGKPPTTIRVEQTDGHTITEVSLLLPGKLDANTGEWEVADRD